MKLHFGEFVLDTAERLLRRGQTEVPLEPKVFDCMALLMRDAGKLVTIDRLRSTLWPGVHVGDDALRRIINEARRALGDSGSTQVVIRTRKGLGYVFVPPVVAATDDSLRPHSALASSWPFVGREAELKTLRDWLAAPDNGSLCFISGEAGAGKSSLLAQFATDHPQQGALSRAAPDSNDSRAFAQSAAHGQTRWLFGHCRATPGTPAFWPFREVTLGLLQDSLLRARGLALASQYPGLTWLLPELAGKRRLAQRAVAPNAELRFELCEAFAMLLVSLSRVCPLRIAIEDAHWADDGTLAMLEACARAAREQRLHLFATYRPEAVAKGGTLGALIARNSGRAGTFSLHLGPLGADALRRLLEQLRLPESALRKLPSLLQRSGGNALYVHELVRHSLATGQPLAAELPPSLDQIVNERVAALPAPTQHRLAQAAVLGHNFSVELLETIANGAVWEELAPAEAAGVLQPDRSQPGRMQFNHALVADAIGAAIAVPTKQAYHCAALRALQSLPEGRPSSSELALHAFEAGDRVPLAERRKLCEAAGREAFAGLAFDRAALQLGRALQLVAADDAAPAGAELALIAAQARWHADHPELEVEAAFRDVAARARRAGAPALLAEAAIGYAVGDESTLALRIMSLRPEALALADEAWEGLVQGAADLESWPDHVAYRLAATRCWMRTDAGLVSDVQRAARIALSLAPEQLTPYKALWKLALRAVADYPDSDAHADAIYAGLREPEIDPRQRLEMLVFVMAFRLSRGDREGWERAAAELASPAEALQLPDRAGQRLSTYVSLPEVVPIVRAVMDGEFAGSEMHFLRLVERFAQLGLAPTREADHGAVHILLQLYGYQGRGRELESALEQRVEANSMGRWFQALMRCQFAIERGDRAQARTDFALLRQSEFQPQLGGTPLLTKPETLVRLADACVEIGTPADAALIYERLSPLAAASIQDGLLISWGSASRPLAALAVQLERFELAERLFADALEMNRKLRHRPELVRTQLGLARLWLSTGRRAEAIPLLAAAESEAARMGMAPMIALAQQLRREGESAPKS